MKLRNLLIFLAMLLCQTVLAQQREHTVERGETLASIAEKYGLSEAQLKAANPNMTMCFAGVKLVIPDPNAPAAASDETTSGNSSKKKAKSTEKNDTTSQKSGLLKNLGKSIGKTAKVVGAVATAVVVSKVKGDSWYDAINNAIESADSTMSGGKNEHGISSLLSTKSVKKKAREKVTELVDDAAEKGAAAVKEGIDEVVAKVESDPELEKLYEEYKAKYDDFVSQLEKVKNVYTKANTVAKQRTWKTVSDATKDFKTQLEKVRTECEMYTGKVISAASVESWVPLSPKR
jgi:murein DD-endopeptidase MepM/ murein hydrolase activator NlpD